MSASGAGAAPGPTAAPLVKICGVRTLGDALACAEAGADLIGFNFWPRSKRFLELGTAVEIAGALPPALRKVGVFVNASEDELLRALDSGAIDLAQLHGDEPPELLARLGPRAFKALRLRDEASLDGLERWPGEWLLVDADSPGYGGSGQLADRALARRAAERRPILLAGGLTAANVAAAIREVRPLGVDVAGGVERAPGEKDWTQIAAFVRAAKAALQGEP